MHGLEHAAPQGLCSSSRARTCCSRCVAKARQAHLRRLQKQAHTPPLLPACPRCACVREEEQHVLAAMQDDPRYAFYSAPDAEDDAIFRSYKSQLCEQVRGGTF